MANITGGELKFEYNLDTSKLDKALRDSEGKLKGFTEIAEELGTTLDRSFKSETIDKLRELGVVSGNTGKEMKNALKDAEQFVSGMEKGMEVINGALDAFNQAISEETNFDRKNELIEEFTRLSTEADEAARKTVIFRNVLEDYKDQNASVASKLREVKEEMQQLDAMGERNSAKYAELSKKAGEYSTSVQRVNDEVRALTGGGLAGLMSGLNAVSSVVVTSAGAYGLLAKESENIQKLTEKINSITAIAVGIGQGYNQVQRDGAVVLATVSRAKQFLTTTTTQLSTALNISTAAARGLLGAISGGLLIAIPVLVDWISRLVQKQREAAEIREQLIKASKAGLEDSASEISQLKLLYTAATDVTRSIDDRTKSIEELKKQFPDHFGNIENEIILNGKAEESYYKVATAIQAASKARALTTVLDKRQMDLYQKQFELREKRDEFIRDMGRSVDRTIDTGEGTVFISGDQARAKNRQKAIEMEVEAMKLELEFNRKNAALIREINNLQDKGRLGSTVKTTTPRSTRTTTPRTQSGTGGPIVESILPEGSVIEIRTRLNEIEKELERATDLNVIEGLKEKRLATAKELADAEARIAIEADNNEREALQKKLNDFLISQRTFAEKKEAIIKEFDELRSVASTDAEKAKVEQGFADALQSLNSEELKKSQLWAKAFGDTTEYSIKQLQEILTNLKAQISENADKYSAADLKALNDQVEKLENQVVGSRNPFAQIKEAIRAIGDESLTTSQKVKAIDGAIAGLKKISSIVNSISDSLGLAKGEFGEFLDLVSSTIDGVKQMRDSYKDMLQADKDGDPVGKLLGQIGVARAAVGIIAKGVKWITSLSDRKREREIKRWADEVRSLESAYNDLERAIGKALGEQVYATSKAAIANLKQQQILLASMIKAEQAKKKADKNKIEEYKQAMKDIDIAIADMQESMLDKILSGNDAKTLADKLSDALVDAFKNGENAAEAMGKTVDEVLRDMVQNALKVKLLEEPIQKVIDQMLNAMGFKKGADGVTGSFDGLSENERKELKEMMQSAGQNYMNALKEYADLFGAAAGQAQGLKGDIKGITEKTAGALEAQINAVRILAAESLTQSRLSVSALDEIIRYNAEIAYNTKALHRIDKNIEELNNKSKSGLAGI